MVVVQEVVVVVQEVPHHQLLVSILELQVPIIQLLSVLVELAHLKARVVQTALMAPTHPLMA